MDCDARSKQAYLIVPWDILHRQSGGLAIATECDTFDFDETRLSERDELGVTFNLIRVPSLHQGQTINGALSLSIAKASGQEERTFDCPNC